MPLQKQLTAMSRVPYANRDDAPEFCAAAAEDERPRDGVNRYRPLVYRSRARIDRDAVYVAAGESACCSCRTFRRKRRTAFDPAVDQDGGLFRGLRLLFP